MEKRDAILDILGFILMLAQMELLVNAGILILVGYKTVYFLGYAMLPSFG